MNGNPASILRIYGCLALLAFLLMGCSGLWNQPDHGNTAEGRMFNAVYKAVLKNDRAFIKSKLDPSLSANPRLDEGISFAQNFIATKKLKFVGFSEWKITNSLQNGRTSELEGIFQSAEFPDQGVKVKALFLGLPEKLKINDINLQTFVGTITSTSGSMALDFATLSKLGFLQLGALLLAALSLCTCLAAFVVCLMTRQLRSKWLWAIFTLVGICPMSLDVTTGKVAIEPIAAMLLGGGISPYVAKFGLTLLPYEPMSGQLIVFSIPFGALIFLYKIARHKFA